MSALTFNASYPVPATQKAIVIQLCRRGLGKSKPGDPRCCVQWVPYTSISWRPVLANRRLVSSYYAHHGLVNKDALFQVLEGACCRDAEAPTDDQALLRRVVLPTMAGVRLQDHAAVAGVAARVKREGGIWVVKSAGTNNALGVHFFHAHHVDALLARVSSTLAATTSSSSSVPLDGPAAASGAASAGAVAEAGSGGAAALDAGGASAVALDAGAGAGAGADGGTGDRMTAAVAATNARALSDTWVVQRYLDAPMLADGRKFHLRVNVLAQGALRVFVHRDVVCHIASEPFTTDNMTNKWQHITNHGVQRHHPTYNRDRNTVLLPRLVELVADSAVSADAVFSSVCDAVAAVFCAFKTHRKLFLPMPNCFELFGFDFMLRPDGCPVLLEVNGGPALEGTAMPELCSPVVDDTLKLVLDPFLPSTLQSDDNDGDGDDSGDSSPKASATRWVPVLRDGSAMVTDDLSAHMATIVDRVRGAR